MYKTGRVVLSAALLLAACSKKEDKGAGGGSAGFTPAGSEPKATEPAKGAKPAAFGAWSPKGASMAWQQGAWISRLTLRTSGTISMAGDPAAIEVKGDQAKVFDGKEEHTLGFSIDSPCTVAFTKTLTEGSMKGGTQTISKNFLVADGGKFLVGDGAVGYRKGKTAFVCATGDVDFVELDDKGACKGWKQKFEEWEEKPVKCEWIDKDGKEALKIGEGDWPMTLVADGDLLQSEQFAQMVKENYHQPAKSWDEAKAAVSAKVKENDPGEQAKAAGGKVGETNTVASLMATFAADRKSVEGKPVELTALYLNSNRSTSNGKTTYNAMLVDSKENTKLVLPCSLDAEVKDIKQYDKVTVKGTVGESFDKPSLDGCTVAKAK